MDPVAPNVVFQEVQAPAKPVPEAVPITQAPANVQSTASKVWNASKITGGILFEIGKSFASSVASGVGIAAAGVLVMSPIHQIKNSD